MTTLLKRTLRRGLSLTSSAAVPGQDEIRERWREARTVCLLSASGIGDALMATPLLEEIKACRPQARTVVVTTEASRPVFAANPRADVVLSYDLSSRSSFVRLLGAVRSARADVFLAAQPANTVRHSLVALASGAPLRLKHSYDYGDGQERDYSFVYHALLPGESGHRVERNLEFLRFLGADVRKGEHRPRFTVDEGARRRMAERIEGMKTPGARRRLCAMHPGGLRENKKWPASNYAEAAEKIRDLGFTVCLVGGPRERGDAAEILAAAGTRGMVDVSGKLPLNETAALLEQCAFLISNDTGIMHLATAVDTPVVALFGPTDFRAVGPCTGKARVLAGEGSVESITVENVMKEVLHFVRGAS